MATGSGSKRWQRSELDETWRQLRRVAERVARRITGSTQDAEDVAQATLAAYGLVSEAVENPEAWVTQVAMNLSLNLVRDRRRATPTEPSKLYEQDQDRSRDKPNEVDRLVGDILVDQLLARLSSQQQATLRLKYGAGLERATIADILGVTRETIKTHLKRGTTQLRGITKDLRGEG